MAIDTKKILASINIVDVISEYIQLKPEGGEMVGNCIFHEDKSASLKVNPKKQIFKCFVCDKVGGDAIEFLLLKGFKLKEACNKLSGGSYTEVSNQVIKQVPLLSKEPEWKPISSVGSPSPVFSHATHGTPTKTWAYHDKDGVVLSYACRFDTPEKKFVLPFTYATNGSVNQWRWLGLNLPRPIYNLHIVSRNPGATILVVEGEKTADAAQSQLDEKKTVVVTWFGGSGGTKSTDFSPIKGRKVIYWPDNDKEGTYGDSHPLAGQLKPWYLQAGNKAMLEVYEVLKESSLTSRWVNNPDDLPNKWDCADKDWKPGELREFLLQPGRLTDVPKITDSNNVSAPIQPTTVNEPKKEIVPPKNPEIPPISFYGGQDFENEYFKMLGYEEDENVKIVFYFFAFQAKTLVRLSPTSMNKSNLQLIAPLNFWETRFPGAKSKFDLDAAQNFLINNSYRVGMFLDEFIRGRGAWMEGDKLVIHTGESLLIEGHHHPLKNFNSKYVYKIGKPLGFGFGDPLKSIDSKKALDKVKWLLWEREIDAYLLIGWCVIAPFCGVLQWRPHIWITGPSGSGKSWTLDNVIKRLLGNVALQVQGKTTEAGVRGLLKSDARPVLFDESDVDSAGDKERIQSAVALARSSSYHNGADIVKGTQTGGAKTYSIRSVFCFSSIGVQLNQRSDLSRFTILGLQSFDGLRDKDDFAKFESEWNEIVTSNFVAGLQARTMKLIPVILKNAKIFSDVASVVIGNRRIGDQVGSMLAGAYSLSSSKEISYEDAIKWIETKDWTEEKGLEQTKDEVQLFSYILSTIVDVEGTYGVSRRTIGELILIAAHRVTEPSISSESAHNRLRRIGIMISDDLIYISNSSTAIKEIIRNTSWSASHGKILERLEGAKKVSGRTYIHGGVSQRGVSIPLSSINLNSGSSVSIDPIQSKDDNDFPF